MRHTHRLNRRHRSNLGCAWIFSFSLVACFRSDQQISTNDKTKANRMEPTDRINAKRRPLERRVSSDSDFREVKCRPTRVFTLSQKTKATTACRVLSAKLHFNRHVKSKTRYIDKKLISRAPSPCYRTTAAAAAVITAVVTNICITYKDVWAAVEFKILV